MALVHKEVQALRSAIKSGQSALEERARNFKLTSPSKVKAISQFKNNEITAEECINKLKG